MNRREKLSLCDNIPIIFSDFHLSPNDKDDKIFLDDLLKKIGKIKLYIPQLALLSFCSFTQSYFLVR